MLRPHNRTSFIHTEEDMQNIFYDMKDFIENGVDGFVFGALRPDRSIDADKCRSVIAQSNGLPVTFHRAFDMSIPADMLANLELIANMGFKRLLTSGLAETAEDGITTLRELIESADDKQLSIVVMPGCGITRYNAENIVEDTRCREFHGSAKHRVVESIPAHDSDTPAITAAIAANGCNYASKENVELLVWDRDNNMACAKRRLRF